MKRCRRGRFAPALLVGFGTWIPLTSYGRPDPKPLPCDSPAQAREARWIGRLGQADGTEEEASPLANLVAMGPEALPSLLKACRPPTDLQDRDRRRRAWAMSFWTRMRAIQAIEEIGDPLASETLGRLASDPREHPGIRSAAALALGRTGGPETVKALRRLLAGVTDRAELKRGASPAVTSDYVRRCAALALGRLKAKEAAADLLATASDDGESPHLRLAALMALAETEDARMGAELLALAQRLEDARGRAKSMPERSLREGLLKGVYLAAGTCAQEGDPCVYLKTLSDCKASSDLRKTAALAFGMAAKASETGRLSPFLKDKAAEVRVATATAIGELTGGRDPEARKALLDALKQARLSPDIRVAAAASLGTFPAPESLSGLETALLEDPCEEVQIRAVHAAGRLRGDDGRPLLLRKLERTKDPSMRCEILGMLAEEGLDAGAADALVHLLKTRDPGLRAKACAALERVAGEGAGAALARMLDDPSPRVRKSATLSIAVSGRKELAPALSARAEDGFDTVRQAAAEALAFLRTGKASAWLTQALQERRAPVRGGLADEWSRIRSSAVQDVLQIGLADLQQMTWERDAVLASSTSEVQTQQSAKVERDAENAKHELSNAEREVESAQHNLLDAEREAENAQREVEASKRIVETEKLNLVAWSYRVHALHTEEENRLRAELRKKYPSTTPSNSISQKQLVELHEFGYVVSEDPSPEEFARGSSDSWWTHAMDDSSDVELLKVLEPIKRAIFDKGKGEAHQAAVAKAEAAKKAYEAAVAKAEAARKAYEVSEENMKVAKKMKNHYEVTGALKASDYGVVFAEDDPRRILREQLGKKDYLSLRPLSAPEKRRRENRETISRP